MQVCDKSKCTACYACVNSCNKKAISMIEDELGRLLPYIDSNLCVNCYRCKKICPANLEDRQLKYPIKVYAAWSDDPNDQRQSSSGGIGAVLARVMLSEYYGVVVGAAFQDSCVQHILIEKEKEIEQLRGSKYVYSQMGNIYIKIAQNLSNNKKVLFIGTPCQVAGVKSFFRNQLDNLVMVDLICHGVPPFSYLKEHCDHLMNCQEYDNVKFRGENDFHLIISQNEIQKYITKANTDYYFSAFLDGLTYRENCYTCPYARGERVSDITIGDFWGIDRNSLIHNEYLGKISLVLVNTKKGEQYFDRCKQKIVCEERTMSEAQNPKQGNLIRPTELHPERNQFEEQYKLGGFDKAVSLTKVGKKVRKERVICFVNRFLPVDKVRSIRSKIIMHLCVKESSIAPMHQKGRSESRHTER